MKRSEIYLIIEREKENRETERKRDFDFLKKYLFCVVAIGIVCVQIIDLG